MSVVAERIQPWLITLLQAGGPTLVFGVAGALLGLLVALALAWLCGHLLRWRGSRSVRVASLAARGVSRAEIARRTGLSQDAVGMLLKVRRSRRGRPNLPAPARIAAFHRADAHRRNRDWNPQVVINARDTGFVEGSPYAARPLPSVLTTSTRLTRSGQVA